jgi:hypothetical protein
LTREITKSFPVGHIQVQEKYCLLRLTGFIVYRSFPQFPRLDTLCALCEPEFVGAETNTEF